MAHRVVHGGFHRTEPQRVKPDLLADLRAAVPLDAAHLPAEIALIEAAAEKLPGVPQVVAFDTAFHRDLPAVARTLPILRRYADAGLRRFGFHGLSFTYLMGELARTAPTLAAGRVVLAHLGSGSSLAAVRGGKPVDTTMGLTPAGGLVMGTRPGDLDPGVLAYLARTEGWHGDRLDAFINKECGLKGVSGTTADMRELLEKRHADPHAAAAVDLYCYQARKHVAAMAAAMGGLDALVFSGGIGEKSAAIRRDVCSGLEFLGVALDAAANSANAAVISAGSSRTSVRVIPTDEEATLARLADRLLSAP